MDHCPDSFYQATAICQAIANTGLQPEYLADGKSFGVFTRFELQWGDGKIRHRFSIGAGAQYKKDNWQAGVNAALNIYNNGIGTTSGSTGKLENRSEFILSPSLTLGNGKAPAMPLNTFNGLTETGVKNSFHNALTLGRNYIFDSAGRDQITSSVGLKFGDTTVHTYNDMKGGVFFGDGGDRYHTANIEVTRLQDGMFYTLGNVMYTGEKWWNKNGGTKTFRHDGNNYYLQPSVHDFLLNNGETYLTTRNAAGVFMDRRWARGAGHLLPQRLVHAPQGIPYFFSIAKDESNTPSYHQQEFTRDLLNYKKASASGMQWPADEKFKKVLDSLPDLGGSQDKNQDPFELLK